MLFFSQKSTTDLSAFVVWPWTTRLCPHITTVVWDEAVFCRKARVPGLGSASSILCPYGVCSWRPHPRSQFFRCQSPDFSPNVFFCKDSCARTKLPTTYLDLHSCIWPSLDDLGPAKATETPVRHVPPASCEHGWCSALGAVASNAQEGELPWTSYASSGSSWRVENLQETLPAASLLSPFFPFPKVMLFNVGEKDAACLGHWAVC